MVSDPPDRAWDARIDELFGLPAGEFVAARDGLARELRAAGERTAAAEVRALRRPTVVAWSINQVARTHATDVAALVAAGATLREAQLGAADGVGTDLRAASRRRRTLLDDLTDAAAALTDNPSGHRAAIEATLDGASLDPDLEAVLIAGRLARELPPTARFAFADATPGTSPPTSRATPARRAAPKPVRDDLAVRRARQALEQARSRAEVAEAGARDAGDAVDDAQHELDAATRRVTDLHSALESARTELLQAKRRVSEARRAETAAKAAERRAAASLRSAEGAAADAEASNR
jgi:hypothetical protein